MSTQTYRQLLSRSWRSRRRTRALSPSWSPGQASPRLGPRQKLRRELFERVLRDVEAEGSAGLEEPETARARIRRLLHEGSRRAGQVPLSAAEQVVLEDAILAELTGFGPLECLVTDPTVSDILVNGPHDVWVDRFGRLEPTRVRFDDDEHLLRVLSRLVAGHGRHLENATPYVDVRLADGSRLHAMIPPISTVGPVMAIRRARPMAFDLPQLYACDTLSPEMGQFLSTAVRNGLSVLVSGGAATGKTTLLNVLSQFIPPHERVVTIEETIELHFNHPHAVSLESRLPNVEGRGEVGLRTLVRNALRMRADRIVVGEVRGAEVFEMLQAMNVGHHGSMTTVHANSPEDALRRLETLVLMSGVDMPSRAVRELLAAAFDLIVHTKRFPDGTRRVTSIREVFVEGDGLGTRELFRYEWKSTGAKRVRGKHVATGEKSACLAELGVTDADQGTNGL